MAGTIEDEVLASSKTPFHLKIVIEMCGGPTCQLGGHDVDQPCQDIRSFFHASLMKGGEYWINGLLV